MTDVFSDKKQERFMLKNVGVRNIANFKLILVATLSLLE